jgi:hypothetical protein
MSTTGSTVTRTRSGSNDDEPPELVGAVGAEGDALSSGKGLADVAPGGGVLGPPCTPHAVNRNATANGNSLLSNRMPGS